MKTMCYVLGLLGLWLIAGTPDARAAAARSDSVMVIVRGDASEHDRKVVDAALRTAVQNAGWTLVVPPAKSASAVAGCVDAAAADHKPWDCVTAATKPGTGVFLVASVLRDKRDDGAEMTRVLVIVVGYRPNTVDSQQFFCELCTDAKLRDGMGGLVRDVFKRVVLNSGDTMLRVTSKADHATVLVDGEGFGEVNSLIAVIPGKHQVSIRREGVASPAQDITIAEGDTADLTIELTPVAVAVKPLDGHEGAAKTAGGQGGKVATPIVEHAAPSRLWPGVLIGSGVTLLGVGVYDLWRGSDNSTRYNYPNATAIGVGAGIVGAGLAATGIYWWLRSSNATTAPTAYLDAHGVVLGWAGAF